MDSVVIKHIRSRMHEKNQNFLCIFTGATGSGKSYSALEFARKVDPNFKLERLVFSAKDFMALLNSGNLKTGDAIIWDEAGVGISAREWWSISNKAINYVMQTFRHLNLCLIMTVPSFSYIDSGVRKLFHGFVQTLEIDYDKDICYTKFMFITHNPRYDKLYFKYPRMKIDGRIRRISRVKFRKPHHKVLEAYEKKKKAFTKALNEEIGQDLDKYDELKKKNAQPKLSNEDYAKIVLKRSKEFQNSKGRLDIFAIAEGLQVSEHRAKKIRWLVNKGKV